MKRTARAASLLIAALASLAAATNTQAEKHCADDVVCLELRSDGGAHDLMVSNLVPGPVTVCVYFTRFEKMKADLPLGTHLGHPAWTGTLGPWKTDRALGLLGTEPDSRFYFMFSYRLGLLNAKHDDSVVYRLPFERGASFRVGQGSHGNTHHGEHTFAVDWDMPVGTKILAARDGVVVRVMDGFSGCSRDEKAKLATNAVCIAHDDGTVGSYEHIRKGGAAVSVGRRVKAGEHIAWSGDVGYGGCDPHLHFGVYAPVSAFERRSYPVRFLTAEGAGTMKTGQVSKAP